MTSKAITGLVVEWMLWMLLFIGLDQVFSLATALVLTVLVAFAFGFSRAAGSP